MTLTKLKRTPPEVPNRFVYRHIRNDNGKPFYIGRGTTNDKAVSDKLFYDRAFKSDGRTKLWRRIVKKANGFQVEIIAENLNLEEAIAKEAEFIAIHGLIKEKGLLCNFIKDDRDRKGFEFTQAQKDKMNKSRRYPIDKHIELYVDFEPNTGCWIWGGLMIEGRPIINTNGKSLQARKYFYEYFNKVVIPLKKKTVKNICGCIYCVNPQHGEIISGGVKPETQNRTLSREQVIAVRKSAKQGGFSINEIARIHNLSKSNVEAILKGRTWKWLKEDFIIYKSPYDNKAKKVFCAETSKYYHTAKEASVEIFGEEKFAREIRSRCAKNKVYKDYNFKFASNG